MKNEPKTSWTYSNGTILIDPYRQKIIWQSGQERHWDAWESVEPLSIYLKNSTKILPFVQSNEELMKHEDEITKAVEYFSSEIFLINNPTIFNAKPSDLIDYSTTLSILRKKKNRNLLLFTALILFLNIGIYLGTLLNDRIAYMFIVSAFLTILLSYSILSDYIKEPKFGKGIILFTKTGKPNVVAGKQVPSTSFYIVVGQQTLYRFKKNTLDTNNYEFKNEITYQVSKEIYTKYKLPYSYINFITSSKNEIFTVLDSYM